MKKVAVFGLGRFGVAVAESLYRERAEVLVMDRSLKLVESVKDSVSVAVAGDATDKAILQAYDVGRMDTAVVAIGSNFEASVLVTMLCKELGVGQVFAKALNPLQARVLHEVGADRVVMPEEEMGLRLAGHILHGSVVDFVQLPPGYGLRRLRVPDSWAGKSLEELQLMREKRLYVVQVVRPGPEAEDTPAAREVGETAGWERTPLPDSKTVLLADDYVDVIGASAALADLD